MLIDDLLRQSKEARSQEPGAQIDLFADFNGMPQGVDKTEFYQHDQNWSNRMILGDSLQVMASLAEREGLRGKVQCIYIDPPYGIKFNSNFQWSTTSRDVKDGNVDHITREPEQVKAFRDTWRDGIHSYLTTSATVSPSPATCSPTQVRSSCRLATRMCIVSGPYWMRCSVRRTSSLRFIQKDMLAVRQQRHCRIYDYFIWYAKNRADEVSATIPRKGLR